MNWDICRQEKVHTLLKSPERARACAEEIIRQPILPFSPLRLAGLDRRMLLCRGCGMGWAEVGGRREEDPGSVRGRKALPGGWGLQLRNGKPKDIWQYCGEGDRVIQVSEQTTGC